MTSTKSKNILSLKKVAINCTSKKGTPMSSNRNYFPHKNSYFVLLGLVTLAILILIFSGLISVTFSALGDAAIVIILVGSLIGSSINIPLYKTQANIPLVREEYVRWFGVTYRIPRSNEVAYTEVDVNVGGALLPAGMSVFLLRYILIIHHPLESRRCTGSDHCHPFSSPTRQGSRH